MSIVEDYQTLNADTIVTFYELDLTKLGGTKLYFTNDTIDGLSHIYWQGILYESVPVEAKGFEISSNSFARPTLKVSSFVGVLRNVTPYYRDLVGAKVTRKRTYVKYLDSINFKPYNPYNGFWFLKGNVLTARWGLASCGTHNSALSFGGDTSVSKNNAERFDGQNWSNISTLLTARHSLAGSGTSLAALSFGGYSNNQVLNTAEAYDGTSWSSIQGLLTARHQLAGCGLKNATIAFGGCIDHSITQVVATEAYNGVSWNIAPSFNSKGPSMSYARRYLSGFGNQNAAVAVGGISSSYHQHTEVFDGVTWSSRGNALVSRHGAAAGGTRAKGLLFGGDNGVGISVAETEEFNGGFWVMSSNLNVARRYLAGAGTSFRGILSISGYTAGTGTAATEKFMSSMDAVGEGHPFDVGVETASLNTPLLSSGILTQLYWDPAYNTVESDITTINNPLLVSGVFTQLYWDPAYNTVDTDNAAIGTPTLVSGVFTQLYWDPAYNTVDTGNAAINTPTLISGVYTEIYQPPIDTILDTDSMSIGIPILSSGMYV